MPTKAGKDGSSTALRTRIASEDFRDTADLAAKSNGRKSAMGVLQANKADSDIKFKALTVFVRTRLYGLFTPVAPAILLISWAARGEYPGRHRKVRIPAATDEPRHARMISKQAFPF